MDDSEMDGWVLAIGRKRRIQSLASDHHDLSVYCPDKRGQRYPGLPESLYVLNEVTEVLAAILNAPVRKFLANFDLIYLNLI